jgi:hypothetical protein
MRKDVKIDRYAVKCRSANTLGYGKWKAEVGDIIVFEENGEHAVGRMAGRVHSAPALISGEKPIKDYILVIALNDALTFSMERWINPADVISIHNPNHVDRKIVEFMAFFLSPEFKDYTPEQLRQWHYSGYATPNIAGIKVGA